MRFLKLGFAAFGPFTGLELDLSGGAPGGFHMVFGPNEAGKSSALRGVHDLLFGFPERTKDAHVHPTSDLRIAATLASEAGEVLAIQRLKRRKDALRDAHDAPLDESALGSLLGGVDAQVFERLFGLDHERLARAGQALLEDKGDVGESLFDAGSGGPGIRRVLTELAEQADEIFKQRSSKASLNVLLETYKEAKTALRDAQVFPEKWQAQSQKLQTERARLEALVERRKKLREESIAQTRLMAALGPLAQRNAFREKRAVLGPLPALAHDARERRERAERILDEATHERARLERDAARRRERLAELIVPENLLGVSADAIERLRDRVGGHRTAEKDLPRRREDVRRGEANLERLVASLYPGQTLEGLEALRPSATEMSRVRKLPQLHAALTERVANAQKRLRNLEVRSAQVRAALAAVPAIGELGVKRRALAAARAKGDVERRVRDAQLAHAQLESLAQSKLSALGSWRGPLEAVAGLCVPQEETLLRFTSELAEIAKSRAELERDRALVLQQLQQNEQRISALEGSGSVPSEAALEQARARRDDGLRRVLRAWGRADAPTLVDPEFSPEQPLSQGFEQALKAADEHADRLRREAERVSTLAQWTAERERLSRERALLEAANQALDGHAAESDAAWRKAWSAAEIEPDSPLEMRAWLGRQRALIELAARLSEAQRELTSAQGEREAVTEELSRALGRSATAAFAPLLAECEEAIETGTLAAQKQTELGEALKDVERQKAECEQELASERAALEHWHDDWRAATVRLGFGSDLSPDEVVTRLDSVSGLFQGLDELSEHRRRARRMEQDRKEFAEHVLEWLKTYAPDLTERAPDVAAEELVRRFQAAEHHRVENAQIQADLAESSRALSALEARAEQAEAELEGLRVLAQAPDLASLPGIEARVAEARELTRQLDTVEAALLQEEGMPLEELLDAARGVDRAALQVRLRELEEELERLDDEIQDLNAQVRDLDHGLNRYEESDAADHAQNLSVQAAEIREEALRYARLRLSSVVLEREVERYREQNQGPVLKRANALFPRLTLGRFRGLRVGVEEQEIVLLRDNGQEVAVDGLSEGTRYQLYLALRIASLERYLERNPPLPLVLDDILIHFDDERAAAALGVLGELAERIQILFFTHHARDLTLAAGVVPETRLFRHSLAGASLK
ncbi:MAG TPA: AAA family ATPase [Polyangiaceae bacterium]|nr:AAA family ATPase [Polyangiaceae bacterium]